MDKIATVPTGAMVLGIMLTPRRRAHAVTVAKSPSALSPAGRYGSLVLPFYDRRQHHQKHGQSDGDGQGGMADGAGALRFIDDLGRREPECEGVVCDLEHSSRRY